MKLQFNVLEGVIYRRILINFRVDPEVLSGIVPKPFVPKLVGSNGLAGICLTMLRQMRPEGLPKIFGMASDNVAHRVMVLRTEENVTHPCVFIPEMYSSSPLNRIAGGLVFPGRQRSASIKTEFSQHKVQVQARNDDGLSIDLSASPTESMPAGSMFSSLDEVSDVLSEHCIGYSCSGEGLSGIRLVTDQWKVCPLDVSRIHSSYFSSSSFPEGSVAFDSAVMMQNIPHKWTVEPDLI